MIICCGEALIDMLPRHINGEGDGFLPVPGGAIFNTAVALGRLGENAGFLSSVSTDMFGEQLIAALHQSNVKTDQCVRSQQPTTLAFVKLTDGHASYSFFDENSAGRNLTFDQIRPVPDEVEALQFGAISLIPEPCGAAYEQLMAENQDKILCLDPNIRPSFIDNPPQHRARILRMAAMADVIKVSDEDLEWLADGHAADELVDLWLEGPTSIVLITRGGAGVDAYTQSGILHQDAVPVEVVDTVGAGDTFNAGFLAGLRRGGLLSKPALAAAAAAAAAADVESDQSLASALHLAAKVASHTVSKPGANPPWQSEL